MKAAPKLIMGYMENPYTWSFKAFETSIRQEVETLRGDLTATDELMLGMLCMSMQTMIEAHLEIKVKGNTYQYNAGEAPSPHLKIRTECLDKIVKIIKEMEILGKSKKRASKVDELFDAA